jgi:hypothetical protein
VRRVRIEAAQDKKKGTPKGYLFSQRTCDQPRQEPGRYFVLTVVPSLAEPQRQPKRPEPEFAE